MVLASSFLTNQDELIRELFKENEIDETLIELITLYIGINDEFLKYCISTAMKSDYPRQKYRIIVTVLEKNPELASYEIWRNCLDSSHNRLEDFLEYLPLILFPGMIIDKSLSAIDVREMKNEVLHVWF